MPSYNPTVWYTCLACIIQRHHTPPGLHWCVLVCVRWFRTVMSTKYARETKIVWAISPGLFSPNRPSDSNRGDLRCPAPCFFVFFGTKVNCYKGEKIFFTKCNTPLTVHSARLGCRRAPSLPFIACGAT